MARDPERRRISREAQNARRKLQRRITRLRKVAKSEKNAKVKAIYRREAQNLEQFVKRTAFKRGESLTQVSKKLERLQKRIEEPSRQSKRNLFVQNEMRRAQDRQPTIFGSGAEGRAKVKSFFMAYSKDWAGEDGDHIENILKAHPEMDLFSLYTASFLQETPTGTTWELFIADYTNFDYSNVDTTSEKFKNQMNERFNNLDSGDQKKIANEFAKLY
jgi:hypothetical protein